MQRHRYAVLDSYRFIAAMGIVAYHFEGHFSVFTGRPSEALAGFQTLVDFFFVLSGFVLMHTYGDRIASMSDYRNFLRKRFARVYPLHAATLGLCAVLFAAVSLGAIPVHDRSLIDMPLMVPNILLIQAWGFVDRTGLNGPSWSISAEAFVYILFPIFVGIAARLRPVATLGAAVLAAIAIDVWRQAAGLPSGSLATYDFGMLRAVPMFLAGVATYGLVGACPIRPISWLLPHTLFAVIAAMMLLKAPMYAIDVLYPPLVALVALAERGGQPTILARPFVTRLGEASFAIYMEHTFVQVACVGLVRHQGWTSPAALIVTAIMGAVLIVLIGLASFSFFETPMRRWLGGSAPIPEGRSVAGGLPPSPLRPWEISAPN